MRSDFLPSGAFLPGDNVPSIDLGSHPCPVRIIPSWCWRALGRCWSSSSQICLCRGIRRSERAGRLWVGARSTACRHLLMMVLKKGVCWKRRCVLRGPEMCRWLNIINISNWEPVFWWWRVVSCVCIGVFGFSFRWHPGRACGVLLGGYIAAR